MKQRAILLFLFLSFTLSYAGQRYKDVKPLSDFLQTYKDKHRIIIKAIETRSDLSISEKLLLFEKEIDKLKEEFKSIRIKEYQAISAEFSVSHSCTGNTGSVTDCGFRYISAPNKNMYTKDDWIRVTGTNKGTIVEGDGSRAGLKMTVAGNNTNTGTLYAIFRYRPEAILELVNKDVMDLFNQLVK